MDIVDLLPDHPATPKLKRSETFLPNLILFVVFLEETCWIYFDEPFSANTLQFSNPRLNISVTRIDDEMKMVGHYNEAYQPRLAVLSDFLELFEESDAVVVSSEYLSPLVYVAGDIVENTRH